MQRELENLRRRAEGLNPLPIPDDPNADTVDALAPGAFPVRCSFIPASTLGTLHVLREVTVFNASTCACTEATPRHAWLHANLWGLLLLFCAAHHQHQEG